VAKVPVWSAPIIGILAALGVAFLKVLLSIMRENFKIHKRFDEPMWVASIHAGGGLIGMFLTGVFAEYGSKIGPDTSTSCCKLIYPLADLL
jgi:ammonia channel protein AmtB